MAVESRRLRPDSKQALAESSFPINTKLLPNNSQHWEAISELSQRGIARHSVIADESYSPS